MVPVSPALDFCFHMGFLMGSTLGFCIFQHRPYRHQQNIGPENLAQTAVRMLYWDIFRLSHQTGRPD